MVRPLFLILDSVLNANKLLQGEPTEFGALLGNSPVKQSVDLQQLYFGILSPFVSLLMLTTPIHDRLPG